MTVYWHRSRVADLQARQQHQHLNRGSLQQRTQGKCTALGQTLVCAQARSLSGGQCATMHTAFADQALYRQVSWAVTWAIT